MSAAVAAGAGVGGLAEHERNKHSGSGTGSATQYSTGTGSGTGTGTGTQYSQGTDSMTSGRPSAYDSAANPGSRADTGRSNVTSSDYTSGRGSGSGPAIGRDNFTSGPGNTSHSGGSGGGGLASVVPGTQAYRDKHVRQGDDFEGAGMRNQGTGITGGTGNSTGAGSGDNNFYEGNRVSGGGSGHHGHHHGHHGREHPGVGAAAGQFISIPYPLQLQKGITHA